MFFYVDLGHEEGRNEAQLGHANCLEPGEEFFDAKRGVTHLAKTRSSKFE